METLPADSVADVLRVLPPRSLAAARRVCKGWRDIIDAHALLLPYLRLLPYPLRGVFINYIGHERSHLFARPSSSSTFPRIDGLLSFLPIDGEDNWSEVLDHCNGHVLCLINWGLYVCNPATRRWTLLPQLTGGRIGTSCTYIAFDPIVSPHYEVFVIPDVPADEEDQRQPVEGPSSVDKGNKDDPCRFMEWPPSPWILKVFSSQTGLWEHRSFLREGQPAGTLQDMRSDRKPSWTHGFYAVYKNGALYVHCKGAFIARFSLSSDKYQVVDMPVVNRHAYLGTSKNQVYSGVFDRRHIRVWMLSESCGRMEWLLKYEADIWLNAAHVMRQVDGSWMVVEEDSDAETQTEESTEYDSDTEENIEAKSEGTIEWDSDKDGVFTTEARDEHRCDHIFEFLGFHPYKEVVLFFIHLFGVVSYDLNSSKMQYLGWAQPNCYEYSPTNGIYDSFIYTPCMVGDLRHGDNTGQISIED